MESLLLISSILLWTVVLFNLLITFRLIQIVAPSIWKENIPKLRVGQFAPSFSVQNIDGEEITLSKFKNRPLLLIFISTKCSECLEKLPEIQSASSIIEKAGVQISLICDGSQQSVRTLVREFKIDTPVYVAETNNSIWKQYKVSSIPFYCHLDEHSKVQAAGLLDSNLETLVKIWKISSL